jgi:hypothetical protein
LLMFCPLKGSGVSPRRRNTLQSAAVINDLPAPLLVPRTISGGGENLGKRSAALRQPNRVSRCQAGGAPSTQRQAMTLAIELTDQQARALAEAAEQLHVSEAELAAAAVRDLVSAPAPDFAAASQRVLRKNEELYRRLA